MKIYGKFVIVLVIGMLVGSQVGSIHQAFAVAGTPQIDKAVQQFKLAMNNAKEDLRQCEALLNALQQTPLTPAEQKMAKATEALGAAEKSMINANEQAMTIIEELGHLNK